MSELRQALVTGAAGFVGRRLCALLRSEGVRVTGLDRAAPPAAPADAPWDDFRVVDLAAPAGLPADLCAGADTVFHLAALTHAAARGAAMDAYRLANVEVTRRVAQACRDAGVARCVLLSSVKVLGEGGAARQSEQDAPRPTTPYGVTKQEAERLVLGGGGQGPAAPHAAVIRAPLIYGPGVRGNLGLLLQRARDGRLPALPDTGNRRSLVDVRDVAAGLWLAASRPAAAGRVFIVTDGRDYSTWDILAAMREAWGRPQPRRTLPAWLFTVAARVGESLRRVGLPAPYDAETHQKLLGSAFYSAQAAVETLGFTPRHDLRSSLPDMVRALRDTGSRFGVEPAGPAG